jgi:hypothetical protein
LRLHGLIARVPHTQRYEVTQRGIGVTLWFTRCHARLFRPGLTDLLSPGDPAETPLHRALKRFDAEIDAALTAAKLRPAA